MKRRFSWVALAYVLFIATPVYWLLTMSIKNNKDIMSGISWLPVNPDFSNLTVMFTDPAWYWGYINALVYVLMNVVISVTVAIPAAYAFSRYEFRGRRPLFMSLLAFRMMAPVILLAPFVQIFSDLGLIDTHIAVALAHCFFNVPIAIWILEGFISAVPRELDESARIDGYGTTRFFVRILIPQIAPGIAVTAFFCFMFSWIENILSNALTVIDAKPISGIMTRAGGVLSADIAMLAAASVVGLIPGIIFIITIRNHLARGFSMGRVV
jgi:glycerol transport system permease protein